MSFKTCSKKNMSAMQLDKITHYLPASSVKSFAQDMGYEGEPFKWDEEDRRHRMARLDALFFQLYGINKDDAAYILDTFPIVRDHDEKAFGHYRTKELILAYMNAVAAGDLTTIVKL